MKLNNRSTTALLTALISLSAGSTFAATITYNLSNQPSAGDSVLSPTSQTFGLRLDGLISGNADDNYIFNFDDISSNMQLTYDDVTNEIHIFGSSFGGQDANSGSCSGGCTDINGDGMKDGTEALWAMDFTYDINTGLDPGNIGGFDDVLVDQPGHANFGTLSSVFGDFDMRDHYANLFNAAFLFGDDPEVSQNTGVLTGWGWVDYGQNNVWSGSDDPSHAFTSDWLFEATAVPLPTALWLFSFGLLGLAGVAKKRKA